MIDVVWLTYREDVPNRDFWDYSFLKDLLHGTVWKPAGGYEFRHHDNFDEITTGAVVILPARSHKEHVAQLNNDLSKLEWCILFLMGDEDHEFPIDQLKMTHRMKVWVMSPQEKTSSVPQVPFINGYTPETNTLLKEFKDAFDKKQNDVFFSGQVTHSRREDCVAAIKELPEAVNLLLNETKGFTQGIERGQYLKEMASAKIAPCPSGPCIQDTFRLYEALEAGVIPIADAKTPTMTEYDGFWTYLFASDPPFPVIHDWDTLPALVDDILPSWKHESNKVFSWWQMEKRSTAYKLARDIALLSNIEPPTKIKDKITVVIPSSSIPSHPSTKVIEETVRTIRAHLPNVEILITLDGLRTEHEHRKEDYEEYKRQLLWLSNFEWANVLPVIFDEHLHQSGMMRRILDMVKTPTVLYVEQDTPLTPDCDIDWEGITRSIETGEANLVRLSHEALIIPEHKHLMLDDEPKDVSGVPMVRTIQWSQRPHIASAVFYRHLMNNYFTDQSRCFIEDKLHGEVQGEYYRDKDMGWYPWRMFIYHPEGGNIKRSYHTDGRQGEDKLDGTQIW